VPAQTEQADPEDKIIKKKSLNYQKYATIAGIIIALSAAITLILKILGIF